MALCGYMKCGGVMESFILLKKKTKAVSRKIHIHIIYLFTGVHSVVFIYTQLYNHHHSEFRTVYKLTKKSISFSNPDHQAALSMGFLRQQYWTGFPFSSPGDPPGPGIESTSSVDSLR